VASNDPRFGAEPPFGAEAKFGDGPPFEEEHRKRGSWTPYVLGCLGLMLCLFLLCGGAVWYVASNVKRVAADAIRNGVVSGVNSSELSDEDKQKIVVQIDRVVDDFKAGKINLEDLGKIAEELSETPLIGAAIIFMADEKYVKPSGLSDEEKDAARRTLQRVARGVHENKLTMSDLNGSIELISTTGLDGERQLKDSLTDDELKEFMASLKQKADDVEVPDEEFKIDIGNSFKEAIDRALAK
jgi:hypothetical protein